MSTLERSAIVPYSAEQMFALVNDVASYPDYMPGCKATKVLARGEGWSDVRMELAFAALKHSFVTRNTVDEPNSIEMKLSASASLKALQGKWRFDSINEQACRVSLSLEVAVANRIFAWTVSRLFDQLAAQQVNAICQRAKDLYGENRQ